jgi:hypothetical protein
MKGWNIHQSISSVLVTYFYCTTIQILYSTSNILNGIIDIFIMTLLNDFNLLSYVYVEIFHL